MNIQENWEMWKRRRVLSYSKRRNRRIIIWIAIVVCLAIIIFTGNCSNNCSSSKCNAPSYIH